MGCLSLTIPLDGRVGEHHQQELRHVWGAAGDIAGQLGQQVAGAGGSAQHLECVVGADLQPLGKDAFGLLDGDPAGQRGM